MRNRYSPFGRVSIILLLEFDEESNSIKFDDKLRFSIKQSFT